MGKGAERPNRYASFLKRLRAEGRSNMYGAIPYLVAAFGLDRSEAFRIVCEWVDAQAALAGGGRTAPAAAERAPTLFDSPPAVARREGASCAKAGKPPRGGRPRKRKASGRKAA